MNIVNETPKNINELLKMANYKLNWKIRMDAIQKMRKYNCEAVRDKIASMALCDRVFIVKKEAYKAAQSLKITVSGKPIFLSKKDTGYKLNDFKELFGIIKKQSKMEKIDIKKIKERMKILNPEMYDVMLCEKGKKFDTWIKDIYGALPKEK